MNMKFKIALFQIIVYLVTYVSANNIMFVYEIWKIENPKGVLQDGNKCGNNGHCNTLVRLQYVNGSRVNRYNSKIFQKQNVVIAKSSTDILRVVKKYEEKLYGYVDLFVLDVGSTSKKIYYKYQHLNNFITATGFNGNSPKMKTLHLKGNHNITVTTKVGAFCENHNYGPVCKTYCKAGSNSTVGHYHCGPTGQKVCNDNYDPATNCFKKFCETKVCSNGGTCVHNKTNYYCECPRGFTGSNGVNSTNCDVITNYCIAKQPCENNSTCHNTHNGRDYKCECQPTWAGKNCDHHPNFFEKYKTIITAVAGVIGGVILLAIIIKFALTKPTTLAEKQAKMDERQKLTQ